MKNDFIVVGKVVAVHGVKGAIKIRPLSEEGENLLDQKTLLIGKPGKEPELLKIIKMRTHKGVLITQLEDVDSIEKASRLVGREVMVKAGDLPPLEEGEYYWHQLRGLEVLTVSGESLGRIVGLIETGANDVYIVKKGKREILLPAIEDVIKEIDLKKGVAIVDPLDGLIEEDEI